MLIFILNSCSTLVCLWCSFDKRSVRTENIISCRNCYNCLSFYRITEWKDYQNKMQYLEWYQVDILDTNLAFRIQMLFHWISMEIIIRCNCLYLPEFLFLDSDKSTRFNWNKETTKIELISSDNQNQNITCRISSFDEELVTGKYRLVPFLGTDN